MEQLLKNERLGSLDVLRGLDLFFLVFMQPVLKAVEKAVNTPGMKEFMKTFEHADWQGFTLWDIIMPLFLFMAGASMPFAFAKYIEAGKKTDLYIRIGKRVVLLFIFGMLCQGNLLAFDFERIYLYSNTLQAIAIGYMIAAILLIHFKTVAQIALSCGLLITYWALLTFVKKEGYGGGNFSEDYNLAEYVDRIVLGRFRDGSTLTETGVDFGSYRYTWIISSLNFGVTVMTGVFAGQLLKSRLSRYKKILWLFVSGVSMIIAGMLWGKQMPIIKHIWTSSMTLYSSGICILLMALLYFLVDCLNGGKYLNWLKIYGMNSILAYMMYEIIDFNSISNSLFFGTRQYLGDYYAVLIKFINVSFIFVILFLLYRKRKFMKI